MVEVSQVEDRPPDLGGGPSDRYKWVVLSNTTLGMLMATIDISIMLIALPDIFRGIHIDPLSPSNSFYLLWMILGFMVVTSVLVVSFGRLGDMFGRVRMYNLGGGSSYSPCSRSCCRSPGCTARPQPST
jgi:MFS family permease